jgi:arylformamidase
MRLYRDFTTQEELDRQYNPSLAVPAMGSIAERWATDSAAATRLPGAALGVRYGPTRAEYLDIYPAGDGAPVHVFIHGGYWRRFAARDFAFVGAWLAEAGFTAVVVNYDLCPRVTLDEIVREVRAALHWTFHNIASWGGEPGRISVSGHSAGGHLTAMALATDWPGEYDLPADLIKAALPVSGLFDLAPFPYTYLQPALQLGWDQVRRNSPILLEPRHACPVLVAVGGAESEEFRRQSLDFTTYLQARGTKASYLEIPARNHFDVLDGFMANGPLIGGLEAMMPGAG